MKPGSPAIRRSFLWRLLALRIPPLPVWLRELLELQEAETTDSVRTQELIESEPLFRAEFVRIHRLTETPPGEQGLEETVARLGREQLKMMAIGAFLTSFVGAQHSPVWVEFSRRIERLGTTASRMALMAENVNSVEAYVAGLVHHAGTLPLLDTVDPQDQLFSGLPNFTLESISGQWLRFSTDIIELGQAIALLWQFPPALRQSLRVSLDPAKDVPETSLAHIVRAADQLCTAGVSLSEIPDDTSAWQIASGVMPPKKSNILAFTRSVQP